MKGNRHPLWLRGTGLSNKACLYRVCGALCNSGLSHLCSIIVLELLTYSVTTDIFTFTETLFDKFNTLSDEEKGYTKSGKRKIQKNSDRFTVDQRAFNS